MSRCNPFLAPVRLQKASEKEVKAKTAVLIPMIYEDDGEPITFVKVIANYKSCIAE